MKKFLALALALVMALSLVACAPAAKAPEADAPAAENDAPAAAAPAADGEKVIKVGVFQPLTGENGGGGLQETMGIRYANEVYKTVDINGETYTIELVEADNKSDKTEAISAAQSLVSSDVSVVLGSYGSGVSIAAGPTFEEAQIPAIGCGCTNPQVTLGNDFYFRVCFLDPFQGTVMANCAIEEGCKTAAIITQLGDDYSSGLGNFFKQAFAKKLGDAAIVAEEQFQTNQTDFKAILTNVKAANPDVIFAPSSITTAPLLIKQARELGITAKIMGGDTWENVAIIDNAGADSEGVMLSTFFDEADPSTEEAAKFIPGYKEYLVANGQPDIIPAVAALGYDAYITAYKAIEAAQSTDPIAIRDALWGVELDGVTGAISFDENGDAEKDMAFVKTIENGEFKFLKIVTVAE